MPLRAKCSQTSLLKTYSSCIGVEPKPLTNTVLLTVHIILSEILIVKIRAKVNERIALYNKLDRLGGTSNNGQYIIIEQEVRSASLMTLRNLYGISATELTVITDIIHIILSGISDNTRSHLRQTKLSAIDRRPH